MFEARVVRLDGVDSPCILLTPHGEIPEELVVDMQQAMSVELSHKTGPTTYRLEPSSAHDAQPLYRELFDE